MSDFPVLTGSDMVKTLQRGGFSVVRQKGSHVRMASLQDPAKRMTIPIHAHRSLKRGLLLSILEQAGWTITELRTHL